MNSISDRTQCTIAWLPVIILLRFAHVIFIEINVDKIINAFTKIFVNVVNVYHIYGFFAFQYNCYSEVIQTLLLLGLLQLHPTTKKGEGEVSR